MLICNKNCQVLGENLNFVAGMTQRFVSAKRLTRYFSNRPFAAEPSRDLLFIKLWAATLRMPEMEKAC